MDIITLDFETFYNTDYSLRKMSPVEYILDPRYECTGLAIKRGKEPAFWVEGDKVQEFFDSQSENVMCVSHNALFDMCITAWRYGWIPKVMVDTLGVSRSVLQAYLRSMSLNSVAEYLGLGCKTDALANVRNMGLDQIRAHPDLHKRHIEYGLNDVELCYGIFEKLVIEGGFPMMEIAVMDAVLRCAVQPQFRVNVDVLQQSLNTIRTEKEKTLAHVMLLGASGKSDLMSNDKFADLLRMQGVTPPTKISGTTGKTTYAFAKSDQEFIDLLEHPNVAVQALVSTRMGHKSTIEESRHERFINIANLDWPKTKYNPGGYQRLIPMPLRYGGAHTHRLSGDWKMNVQNMGRGSNLRTCLEAPEGHTVIAGDESQVEARFVATLCGQEDLRLAFENGEDVYCYFASDLFGRTITKADQVERWLGKTCILGLGFGLGKDKFGGSIPVLSFNQLGREIPMPPEEAERVVGAYRSRYPHIAATWKLLNTTGIHALSTGNVWQWGPVTFSKETVTLPNGMKLFYHNLRQQAGGRFGTEWVFDYAGKVKRCYGGMLLENIVQALARIVVMEAMIRIRVRLQKLKIPLALQVHDELVFVVRDEYVEVTTKVIEHELRRRPDWLPNLPLDCEVGAGPNYGEAK